MTYRGIVKNGVVVLEEPVLSDGTLVRVEPILQAGSDVNGRESIFQLADRAKKTGIVDLAANHDHYLYGQPKLGHK